MRWVETMGSNRGPEPCLNPTKILGRLLARIRSSAQNDPSLLRGFNLKQNEEMKPNAVKQLTVGTVTE